MAVTSIEPLGHKNDVGSATRDALTAYLRRLRDFRQQDWDNAEVEFFNLDRQHPAPPFPPLPETHRPLSPVAPGKDWDGVFTHTSK